MEEFAFSGVDSFVSTSGEHWASAAGMKIREHSIRFVNLILLVVTKVLIERQ